MAVETLPFIAAVGRMIRAAGRRVGESDEFELYELVELRRVLDEAIADGVRGQLATGRSYTDIGNALGVTRQAARQKWGTPRIGDSRRALMDATIALSVPPTDTDSPGSDA